MIANKNIKKVVANKKGAKSAKDECDVIRDQVFDKKTRRYLVKEFKVVEGSKFECLTDKKECKVYKCQTKDKQQVIAKCKPLTGEDEFKQLQAFGKNQVLFLEKMAKLVPIAAPVGWGYHMEAEMLLFVTEFMQGKKGTLAMVKDESCVKAIGRYLAQLHEASREVSLNQKEVYEYFEQQGTKGQGNGGGNCKLPKTIENYGLVHGNFQFQNFNVLKNASGQWEVRAFDFENVCPAYYWCDLARVIRDGALILEKQQPEEGEYTIYKHQRQFYEHMVDGYNSGSKQKVDLKIFRRNFLSSEMLTSLEKLEQQEQNMKMFHKQFRQGW